MTMRTAILSATVMGLAWVAALAFLVSAGDALADGPTGSTPVTMTFEQPEAREDGDGLSISVRLTNADGEPIARQPVEFFVTPDFFGERPIPLRSAITNPEGTATVTYTPTWEGEHRIMARFAGDETYQAVEVTSALHLAGVPTLEIPAEDHLSALREWATPGAVVVALTVWLVLAAVLVRVGWGIWRAGRHREAELSPAPEAERLPGATFGR